MFPQIKSLLQRQRHIVVTTHNTQFAATKTTAAVQETATSAPKAEGAFTSGRVGNYRKLDNLEKRFLVWTGKYKSIADVPDSVSMDVIERARNRIRIRAANYMIGLTVLGCVIFAFSGKEAAKRGESVKKMNLDWHKKVNEEEKTAK
ncbi:UPF0389 protein CG9231 [Schistocerca gregaria]|uniref:UPF0389 protein CG9231 n=1 Tax=Schistocerca gregaria TaxID=7010 RepID=UPI00211E2AD0|nr:UPF0389 protein CG9231 [Schistocerca gregaria]